MKLHTSTSLFLVFLTVLLIGCSSSNSILGTIGNEQISLREFEEKYAKYNGGWDKSAASTIEEREGFLDLLVKFRLKVQEAKAQGLPQDSAIRQELEGYRYAIATNYVIEKEIVEPNLKKAYEKMKEEVRAFHILFRVDENAPAEDTLAAYEKAIEVRDLITETNFASIARGYSEDLSVEQNGGDLGYFSGGRMVPQFEDAAYTLKPGELTQEPIRTRFGYHLVKVVDRRPAQGAVQLSHILRRFAEDLSDTTAVRDTVSMIYNFLKAGMDFSEAVNRFSDDEGSRERGGAIGEYTTDRLPPDLSELLYKTPTGEVAEPYLTRYGYHIIKVVGRREVPPYQAVEKDLREAYQQSRYAGDYEDYVHELKKKYNLNFDIALLNQVTQAFDSTKTPSDEQWYAGLDASLLERPLFTFAQQTVTVEDFLNRLKGSDEFKNYQLTPAAVQQIVDRISTASVMDEHARRTPERFPHFATIMQEYEEGVLLYRIEQEEVWQKIDLSEENLRRFYNEQKDKYRLPDRVNLVEIYVNTPEIADSLYARIMKGEDIKEIAAETTGRPGYQEKKGEWGLLPVSTNNVTSLAWTMSVDSISTPFANEGGWSIIKVLAKEDARLKTFEEAQAEVTGAYQESSAKNREAEWVASLKNKYGVSLNKKLLSSAFKRKYGEAQ